MILLKFHRMLSFLLALVLLCGGIRLPVQATEGDAPQETVQLSEGFSCPTLTEPNSQSIFMVSLDTGTVVYALNADERRPMASLTKIMTFIVVAEQVQDLQNTWMATPAAAEAIGKDPLVSAAGMVEGEEFTIYELLNLLLVPSAADAAETLKTYVEGLQIKPSDPIYDTDGNGVMSFVELMNQKAVELGCVNTHFCNADGLHDENQYSTAREMAKISQYALSLPYYNEITTQKEYEQRPTNKCRESRRFTNTNRMLDIYSDYYYMYANGGKTGSLAESGYCLSVTGTYEGYSYLIVCMGSPVYAEDGTYIPVHGEMYDARTLFRWAFLNIGTKAIALEGSLLGEVDLKYAWDQDRLQVVVQGNVTAMLPNTVKDSDISYLLDLPEDVKAPVKKGDVIGSVKFLYQDRVLDTKPVVAAESVECSQLLQTLEQGKEILTSPWFLITLLVILVLAGVYVWLTFTMNRKRRKMSRVRKYRDM